MTITNTTGNLLDFKADVLVHQANLFHTFGGGIAAQIVRRFPGAYEADVETPYGDESKLGGFSWALVGRDVGGEYDEVTIVNMYSQLDVSGEMVTSYDHMQTALEDLRNWMVAENKLSVAFPHGMGCGLSRGYWGVVEALIEAVFVGSGIDVTIVRFVR